MEKLFLLLSLGVSLAGCATQKIIPLTSDFWFKKQKTVAVISFPVPRAQQELSGQQGMLDVVASMVHGASRTPINVCLENIDTQSLKLLKERVAERLFQQGFVVKEIDAMPEFELLKAQEGFSHYNVAAQRTNLGTDYVLLLNIPTWGIVRPYYGFIPLTAPQAHVQLKGELVDTHTNRLAWYYDADVIRPIQGSWDDAPNYPNLVHTVEATVDEAKSKLERDLFRTATLPKEIARYSIGH